MFAQPVFDARVARDYDQRVKVPLRNTSARTVTIAARAVAQFDELPADVVGPGSADEPVELSPGESLTLELAVTAPDAVRDVYEIPLEAAGASTLVRVQVDRPELKLSFRVIEQNPITLASTFAITNEGEPVGDLSLALRGSEDNIARLEPTAGHAYLPMGKSLTFTATPVLYLEFERATVEVECRAAGQLRSFPLAFAAPTGRRLRGVRTGCQHHSHAFDWICTNRPRILLTLFGPDCIGEYDDEIREMIREALIDAGLGPFLDVYRVISPAVHTTLDFVGMVEGPIGMAADGANLILYVIEGDWPNAGISAIALIPVIGQGATLSKYGVKITAEAAQRLGKEGLEAAFRRAKAASNVADSVHHLPPTRPRSLLSGPPGAGVARGAGASGPPLRPHAGGGGQDGPQGRPPGGDPPGGDPPGGGGSASGPPAPRRERRGAAKSTPTALGQTPYVECHVAANKYATNWNKEHSDGPRMHVFPETKALPFAANTGPGMYDPLLEYSAGRREKRLTTPLHAAVRNPNGTIYDPTIVWNLESVFGVGNIPFQKLDRFREWDTFEPDTYRDLLEAWLRLVDGGAI